MLLYLENRPILTIIIFVLLMLGFSISTLDVTIMEARNFITAREMIEDGNWILTTMNGEPRYQKPPLPTWLTALSALVFGLKNLFALRLPAILMVAVLGVFSYLLSFKLLNKKTHSLINALITITSFYVVAIIIEAPWDIYTHGFMLMGIYYLFQVFEKENIKNAYILLASIGIGFSILSKGPISFYALLLPFLMAYGFVYKFKNFKKKVLPTIIIVLLGLIVGASWYIYVRLADPEALVAIAERETSNWSSYNVKPFYYYWSFFTQSGLWTIPAFVSLLYPYLKNRVSHLKVYRFSFYWTIFAVILLSIIPEKKSRYLMPVLIPLAINTGFYIEYLIRQFKTLKLKETLVAYIHFGIIILLSFVIPIGGFIFLNSETEINWIVFILDTIILMSIGILMLKNLVKKEIKNVFILTVIFYITLFVLGTPYISSFKNPDYKNISVLKTELENKNLKPYAYGKHVAPETMWYYDGKITNIINPDLTFTFPEEQKFVLIASKIYPERDSILYKKYHFEFISEYDMNTAKPYTRGHKSRLFNKVYLVTKK
ncbi:MAG: phospholipid carrier-dependent glycosyltransferase [Flavobacteriaceae bacterium]|nr:phospholipid carrier-dependent glycosyltransferase [Flavobacteriaceae bacterium]